jgi:20S proteasome alpha/beta subunit
MMNAPIYHRVNKWMQKTNRMTYVLGVRCSDGVVLIGDTKMTVNNGINEKFGDKITGELTGVLTGFSGLRDQFEPFRSQLRELRRNSQKHFTPDTVLKSVKDIFRSLYSQYGNRFNLELLVGISRADLGEKSILYYFHDDGLYQHIDNDYKAIGAEPYGEIYLKQLWNQEMNMDQTAELGYFIVRYIEKFRLDLTVGTGGDRPHPQVRFIPDEKPSEQIFDYPPSTDQYERYENNAQARLTKIEKSLISDYELEKTT